MTDRELLEQILNKITGIEKDVSEIKQTVNNNYDKTLEFYAIQKEHNTEISEKLEIIGARQEIFENQTIKNTAKLQLIK